MSKDLQNLNEDMFKVNSPGKICITNSDASKTSGAIIDGSTVKLFSGDTFSGITIGNDGIAIQGDLQISGYGKTIKKNIYSENPNGAKPYTYTETVYFESAAKEALYTTLGRTVGGEEIGETLETGGVTPIITDIGGGGGIPHVHTISMKHVHAVEPQYLYRPPAIVEQFAGFMSSFTGFLNA